MSSVLDLEKKRQGDVGTGAVGALKKKKKKRAREDRRREGERAEVRSGCVATPGAGTRWRPPIQTVCMTT